MDPPAARGARKPEVYRPAPRRVGYYEDVSTLSLPLDHAAIARILPHRYPFLLVDRIIEFEPDQRIVGIKNVTASERYLSPPDARGERVLPPTILTEAVAQVGGILILAKPENAGHLIFFRGIERARFRGAGQARRHHRHRSPGHPPAQPDGRADRARRASATACWCAAR